MQSHSLRLWPPVLLAAGFFVACSVVSPSRPSIVIDSPPSASQFREGDTVSVQCTATDTNGISRVELLVDGKAVRTDTPPVVQRSYTVILIWKATPGTHTIAVRAFNAANAESDPAAVAIAVLPVAVAGAPTAAATPAASPAAATVPATAPATPPATPPATGPTTAPTVAPAACSNNSSFVSDVTVPDNTVLAAGQPFNKIWRVRNSGTCAWGTGYAFVFDGGTALQTVNVIGVPPTPPGGTADLLIPMAAPKEPGTFTGRWRLRAPNGTLFGLPVVVVIRVLAPQPAATPSPLPPPTSACVGTPSLGFFTASPTTITTGQTATLSFGLVRNADRAEIDNGIGGVATPGSVTVQPTTTTTYTLTGRCGANTASAQVTVVVTAALVRCAIPTESGEAIKAGNSLSSSPALNVGVDSLNRSHRSLLSFDLGGLQGKTIDVANLNLGAPTMQGNPFSLGPLLVEAIDYAPPVIGTDYDLVATPVLNITTGPAGQYGVLGAVQNAASSSRTRVQLRLRLEREASNVANLFTWANNNQICITVSFH